MNSIGVATCWLVGCALGASLLSRFDRGLDTGYGWWLMLCAGILCMAAWLLWPVRSAVWSFLFAAALVAGGGWALTKHPPVTPQVLAYYNRALGDPAVSIVGTISAEPVLADRYQRLRISADRIRPRGASGSQPVTGDLLAVVARYPEYDTGERVALTGTLTAPPNLGEFDYAGYLARGGVYSYMAFPGVRSLGPGTTGLFSREIADARQDARSALKSVLPEPEAALAIGVVVGDRTSMSKNLQEAFQQSGTVHVLAISGENIALLVGFVWLLYAKAGGGRRMPLWLIIAVLAGIAFYTLFTGATVSVVRAAVMSMVLLLAPAVGRRYDPLAALAMTAAIMTFLDPNQVFDPGFDLSFGAMLGIAAFAPAIAGLFSLLRMPGFLSAGLATGLGAQVLTLPLIALLTGRVSLIAPLATLTVDPALLPLMVLGILVVICSQIPLLSVLAVPLAWLSWLAAGWMIWFVQFWSSLPAASIDLGSVDARWVWAYFALVCVGVALLSPIIRRYLLQLRAWEGAMLAAAVMLWAVALWVIFFR